LVGAGGSGVADGEQRTEGLDRVGRNRVQELLSRYNRLRVSSSEA
jgi:hypothetical protein